MQTVTTWDGKQTPVLTWVVLRMPSIPVPLHPPALCEGSSLTKAANAALCTLIYVSK